MNGKNKRWAEQRWDRLQKECREKDRAKQRTMVLANCGQKEREVQDGR